jgi:hypothetical protein
VRPRQLLFVITFGIILASLSPQNVHCHSAVTFFILPSHTLESRTKMQKVLSLQHNNPPPPPASKSSIKIDTQYSTPTPPPAASKLTHNTQRQHQLHEHNIDPLKSAKLVHQHHINTTSWHILNTNTTTINNDTSILINTGWCSESAVNCEGSCNGKFCSSETII